MDKETTGEMAGKFEELELLDSQVRDLQRQLDELGSRRSALLSVLCDATATLPPSDIVTHRERLQQFEQTLGRKEEKNILRDQNRSLILFLLLVSAAGSLVWWALRIMNAG